MNNFSYHRKIFAIQEEFSGMFSHLKLEFNAKPYTSSGASPKKISVSPSKTIWECRTVHTKGILTIKPHMTVSELKEIFNDNLGLSVRVLQKSDNAWHEVTTDLTSLEKLNQAIPENKSI